MSRPRSDRLLSALRMVENGVSVPDAANLHGLNASSIYRAIEHDANPPSVNNCPTCGHKIGIATTNKIQQKRKTK